MRNSATQESGNTSARRATLQRNGNHETERYGGIVTSKLTGKSGAADRVLSRRRGGLADVFIDGRSAAACRGISWNPRILRQQVLYTETAFRRVNIHTRRRPRRWHPRPRERLWSLDALQCSSATGSAGSGPAGGRRIHSG